MKSETTKDNEENAEGAGIGCCGPENFNEMFAKMKDCCPGHGGCFDFSSVKGDMMKNMMQMCCPPQSNDIKKNTEHKNS